MPLGSRIESPWYEWLNDETKRVVHERKCKDCGYRYPTVEVPLFNKWGGGLATHCPVHPKGKKGKMVDALTPKQADTGKYFSKGLLKARTMGATYRRRKCQEPGCEQRWTTIELIPDGILRNSNAECPRCKGETRARIKKVA